MDLKKLEETLKIKLPHIGGVTFQKDDVIHCENRIGGTLLPLGVAGPLKINGQYTKGDYYIPLATTEGALIASVNRGSKAISASGGASSGVELVGVTRGPVFEVKNISQALFFKKWLDEHLSLLQTEARKISTHLKLLKLGTRIAGNYVYVRFYFNTDEAMGMNMATIATDKIVSFIENKAKVSCLAISGNFCVDKKPAWLNFISGRGRRVWAEVIIKKDLVKNILKTSPQKLFDVWLAKCMMGSIMSGSMGFNSHFANVVAAFFAATGQDLAHVVEGSMGVTTMKVLENGDLYVSVYLPTVMLGTVGGGTKLAIKKEALSIMKVTSSDALAEILGCAVLAGEISLLSSLAEGSLAKAHTRLGR